MRPALSAAHEINALWINCAGSARVDVEGCPGDEEVAVIIEKHMTQNDTAAKDQKGGNR